MAKIGLFGGTFNPIHVGHLMIAEEARLAAGLDRVVFIPSGLSYLKDQSQIAAPADRLEMTRLATADAPYFAVSDMEQRRDGPSYTVDTLTVFRALHPADELYLILGADSLLDIDRWRDPAGIFRMARVLAMARGGMDPAALSDQARALSERYGARIQLCSAFSLSLSSSDIRSLIANRHAFRPLVTDRVYRYIMDKGLYSRAVAGRCPAPQLLP